MKKILILVLVALAGLYLATRGDDTSEVKEQEVKVNEEVAEVVETEEVSANDYNDGSYTSQVTYPLPNGGSHFIVVNVTLEADAVTDLVLSYDGENGSASSRSQTRFSETINPFVLTKDLDEITALSRVGGSSLTTDAFNEALGNIKADAS